MLIRFYPDATRDEIDRFQNELRLLTNNYSKDLSAAQLQGFFMHNKDSINDVFANVKLLF
mgnify:CR=1 FL=1